MENYFTEKEIRLIQESYKRLTEKSDKTGEIFYAKLFETNPEIVKLFKDDMKEQSHALMRMVRTVVEGLNNVNIILPAIQELGKRHHDYGVSADQYKTFGECLIKCIEIELGSEFDDDAKTAWNKLYNVLEEIMKGKHYS